MGKIKKLEPEINAVTYTDGRGCIQTYYPQTGAIVEYNYIVTLKNTVRGHHYHKEFDETVMFTTGEGVYLELLEDGSELPITVTPGTSIFIPSGVSHTFIPISDCKMVAMLTKRWDECDEPITSEGK